jgi:hypothetical protein
MIQTALALCTSLRKRLLYASLLIRPDLRISVSCCTTENFPSWVDALIDECKEAETKSSESTQAAPLRFIDRSWLEQHIFHLENDFPSDSLVS